MHCHGVQNAQLAIVARVQNYEAQLEEALQKLPEQVADAYQNRRSGAMELPGSEKWIIPSGIQNEHEFRASVQEAMGSKESHNLSTIGCAVSLQCLQVPLRHDISSTSSEVESEVDE